MSRNFISTTRISSSVCAGEQEGLLTKVGMQNSKFHTETTLDSRQLVAATCIEGLFCVLSANSSKNTPAARSSNLALRLEFEGPCEAVL